MAIEQVTPPDAQAGLESDLEAVYLDVRTEAEFSQGHPGEALNIPVAFPNPMGGMQPNPDFLKIVQKLLPVDKKIYCGCQAGVRSQAAADILAKAGYTNLFNVQGGFGGRVNPGTGMVVTPGWRDSGLPVSTEVNEQNGYAALKKKAGV